MTADEWQAILDDGTLQALTIYGVVTNRSIVTADGTVVGALPPAVRYTPNGGVAGGGSLDLSPLLILGGLIVLVVVLLK